MLKKNRYKYQQKFKRCSSEKQLVNILRETFQQDCKKKNSFLSSVVKNEWSKISCGTKDLLDLN